MKTVSHSLKSAISLRERVLGKHIQSTDTNVAYESTNNFMFAKIRQEYRCILALAIIPVVCIVLFSLNVWLGITICVLGVVWAVKISCFQSAERIRITEFEQVNVYVEQMLYAFDDCGKVLVSLQRVYELFDRRMPIAKTIHEAIEMIIAGNSGNGTDVYVVALQHIYQRYPYLHVARLHDLLVAVECDGGQVNTAIQLMLTSRTHWAMRTDALRMALHAKAIESLIAVGMSLLLLAALPRMIPIEVAGDLMRHPLLQIMHVIAIIVFGVLVIRIIRARGTWDKQVQAQVRHPQRVYDQLHQPTRLSWVRIIVSTIMLLSSIFIAVITKIWWLAILISIVAVLVLTIPLVARRVLFKSARREIEVTFPTWMQHMALLMQRDNVHVAIAKSVEQTSGLLRIELDNLIRDLESDPIALSPYMRFLSVLNDARISAGMRMLYALDRGVSADPVTQVAALVQRSDSALDQAARQASHNQVASLGRFTLGANVIGMSVMLVNIAVILTGLLSQLQ